MSTYYIASQGKQQGPFTIQEIEVKLTSQKINWHDYIYDDKAEDWVLLMEYAPFTQLFNKSFQTPLAVVKDKPDVDPAKKRQWFVLKQNTNYGPFSKLDLIQMLQSKTLHEYDFIWHENMTAWKRLAEVQEFSVQEIRLLFDKYAKKKDANDKVFFRRKYARAKVDSHAIVHDKKKIYKSVGVEISEGGAGLMIEEGEFEKDQQVYLHFKPAPEVPAFNAICKIVSKKGNIYGVQFLKISAAAKTYIANYTKKKAA